MFGGLIRPGVSFTPQGAMNGLGLAPQPNALVSGSFVYLAASDHGRVKVGVSTNPSSRLAQLQTSSPFPVHFAYIGVTPGTGYDIERATHQILNEYRCVGEWFNVPEEMAVAAINAAAYRIGQKLVAVDPDQVDRIVQLAAQETPQKPPMFRKPPKLLLSFIFVVSSVAWIMIVRAFWQ